MKKIALLIIIILLVGFGYFLWQLNRGTEIKKEELKIAGSDTLLQLVANLVEVYSEKNPGAKISVAGGGSGTGIAAAINREIDIALSSRPLKEEEEQLFRERGIEYYEIIIARDVLSIIVHPENPIEALTLEEVVKIYRGEVTNWKEVGGKDQKITLYGRTSASGTYIYFRDEILKGDYSLEMREMPGNQAIIESLKVDLSGIGYVSSGYLLKEGKPIEEVKALKIAEEESKEAISPFESGYSGVLARALYQYIADKPQPGSLLAEFIKFLLSEEGEEIVVATGFLPPFPEDKKQNQRVLELVR